MVARAVSTMRGAVMTNNSPARFRLIAGLVLALALVAAACGSSGDAGTTSTAAAQATTTTTAQAATTTTTAPSTDTTAPAPGTITSTLPGEPIDIYARAGDVLGVVAVASNDVLNLRSGPGTDNPVLLQLPATKDNLIATGQNRLLSQSIWYQVTVDGVPGWVSARFVAFLGSVDDATSEIVTQFGTTPVAETMEDLGLLVANLVASEDPPSRIRMSVAPTTGDLGEVTYDVVGLGDDALLGFRLHLFGDATESGGAFSLKSVERTLLCLRGVSAEGLCA